MIAKGWKNRMGAHNSEIVERHMKELPVRLGEMAKELKVRVQISALAPNCSGEIRRCDDGAGYDYEIKINRYESRERQRFTLAHEIAHYLLHRDIINDRGADGLQDNVLYRSEGASKKEEHEANRLAAEIVMPQNHLAAKMKAFDKVLSENAIEDLAEQFRVSKAAMEVRIRNYS